MLSSPGACPPRAILDRLGAPVFRWPESSLPASHVSNISVTVVTPLIAGKPAGEGAGLFIVSTMTEARRQAVSSCG